MPNHIQNQIKFIGNLKDIKKVMNKIKGKSEDNVEMQIDFNKIKPMPKGMDIEVDSRIKMWVEICTGQIDFACLFSEMKDTPENLFKANDYKTLSNRMSSMTAFEHLIGKRTGNVKDFSEEDFNNFIQCIKNYRESGSTLWYEWSIKNWGTKWNAYGQNDNRNTKDIIYFQTAWSSPIKLIQQLSEMFPLVRIELSYADEDSGSNTGIILFENGEVLEVTQPESGSKEGYDIYFDLNPGSIDNYKLVDGNYIYVDED